MGSSFKPQDPNFSVFDNFIHEPSYLTGMIAGGTTKSNIIGMVGGYAIPEVNRLMNAFMDGALSVNPDAKFLVTFIGSWYDPPKAKEAAFAMIDAGADIMYAERFGVSDAAKERGVKAIGNVIDTSADYPGTILASALWHMEPSIDTAIAAVLDGSYDAGRLRQVQLHGRMAAARSSPTRRWSTRRSSTRSRPRKPRSRPAPSPSRSTTPSPSRRCRSCWMSAVASFEARSLSDRAPQDEDVGVLQLRSRLCTIRRAHPIPHPEVLGRSASLEGRTTLIEVGRA